MKNQSAINLRLARGICAIFTLLTAPYGYAADLHVVSSGGFAGAYKELAPEFEKQTGNKLITAWGLSNGASKNAIPIRLERGEDIDVVLMTGDSLDELMARGKLLPGSKVLLANSPIACAVRQGEPKPDISTVTNLKDAFLGAKTIAYSNGASGEYIKNRLMIHLGIKGQMDGKLKQTLATPVGEAIASGDAEIGCQQLSELKEIKGIEIIGLLPQEVQLITPLFGAVVARSIVPMQARDLLIFLSSLANAHVLVANGLTPVTPNN